MPLQTGIIYGPVRSRRLGASLGVNLLPTHYKLCSFNCLYCQYGWTPKPTLTINDHARELPRGAEVSSALEERLQGAVKRKEKIDCITFSGNGEPTLHPELADIVAAVRALRDRYLPKAKLAILSNSSTVGRAEVREALAALDLRLMKFDAGTEDIIRRLNGVPAPFYIGEVVAGLKALKEVILQSMFVQGRVANTDPDSLEYWLEKVREVRPTLVQVYTLHRPPAEKRLWKVNLPTLQWIAGQVRWRAGVPAEVY